jgi:ATPase family associated with various cellular activities (AAA)
MNNETIILKSEELKPLLIEVREKIKNSPWAENLNMWEKSPYGLGPVGNSALNVLENIIALTIAWETLLDDEIGEIKSPEPKLSILFSLYISSWYGTKQLDEITNYTVRTKNSFKIEEIKHIFENTDFTKVLLNDSFLFVKNHCSGDINSAVEGLNAYFHILKRSLEDIALDPRYRKAKKVLEKMKFKSLNLDFELFTPPLEKNSNNSMISIDLSEIIGNTNYIEAGKRMVRDLLAFDPTAKTNPKKMNQILFGLGRPGCGKTATANGIGKYLLEKASKIGLDAKFVSIRRTDWASSYQNASSKALIECFTSQLEDYKGVVAFYWPDIDTAFSSRGGGDLKSEEKGILGTAFGLFDGSILPFNGQWILICDANYMQMDEATVSRLSQDPYKVNGPESGGDYISLLKDILLGKEYVEHIEGDDKQWEIVGDLAVKLQLSGRDFANLSRRIVSKIENFEYPDGFFEGNFEKRIEFIKKSRVKIKVEDIINDINELEKFKNEASIMDRREKLENMINGISLQIDAEQGFIESRKLSAEESDKNSL